MLNYKWKLKDTEFKKDQGTVFSCFACGGGSTMGYKLAGFDVLGFNEIDPKMADCYFVNHHPKYSYVEPIQEFKKRKDLPLDLYELDILDLSPPCSSFSLSGNREKDWGKEKKFREGQQEQVLDTLFFDALDLARELQPKVIICENVKGLLSGEAKKYFQKIMQTISDMDYKATYKVLNAADMGIPQRRERVFICALREDLADSVGYVDLFQDEPLLELFFNEKHIPYKKIRETDGNKSAIGLAEKMSHYWKLTKPGVSFSTAHPKGSYFNEIKTHPDKVLPTIRASGLPYDYEIERTLFKNEILKAGSYPLDYNFLTQKPNYLVGMSVPPLMIAKIAEQINKQWLKN